MLWGLKEVKIINQAQSGWMSQLRCAGVCGCASWHVDSGRTPKSHMTAVSEQGPACSWFAMDFPVMVYKRKILQSRQPPLFVLPVFRRMRTKGLELHRAEENHVEHVVAAIIAYSHCFPWVICVIVMYGKLSY